MLDWLDPERERAAKRYEEIRRRLIKFYTCRNCTTPEDLTDETINRVARKVQEELRHNYVGDTAPYFYGVAHKVYLEHVKKKPPPHPPPAQRATEEVEREHTCLDRCMEQLRPRSRELIREFYQEEKQAKIKHRKRLAERMGISPNALRIQAHRIRLSLLECVRQCLSQYELL
jgi:DNA-directed RNA polymerase specialized sigma24 family protein